VHLTFIQAKRIRPAAPRVSAAKPAASRVSAFVVLTIDGSIWLDPSGSFG
jgi:hypothetical protein